MTEREVAVWPEDNLLHEYRIYSIKPLDSGDIVVPQVGGNIIAIHNVGRIRELKNLSPSELSRILNEKEN